MNIASADESGAWLSHWPLVGNLRTPLRAAGSRRTAGCRVRQREGRVVPLAAWQFQGAWRADRAGAAREAAATHAGSRSATARHRPLRGGTGRPDGDQRDRRQSRPRAGRRRACDRLRVRDRAARERRRGARTRDLRVRRADRAHRGNYDESVVCAAQLAQANGWYVVSDTSYDGYEAIPRDVMQGYGVIAAEAAAQAAEDDGRPFTHVLLQVAWAASPRASRVTCGSATACSGRVSSSSSRVRPTACTRVRSRGARPGDRQRRFRDGRKPRAARRRRWHGTSSRCASTTSC